MSLLKTSVLLILAAVVYAHDFTLCSGVDDHLGVTTVDFNPDEPAGGELLQVTLLGTNDEEVSGGTAKFTVTAFGIKVADISFDLCKDMGLTCPVAAQTSWKAGLNYTLPKLPIPAGLKADGQLVVTSTAGAELSCLNVVVTIGKGEDLATTHVNGQERIEFLNNMNQGWTSAASQRFENATLEHVKRMCGTVMQGEENYLELPAKEFAVQAQDLPNEFDSRMQWPQCSSVINHIRDQSDCGSCWAFGSTEAFNDRQCIVNKMTTLLSPEDTNDCCGFLQCMSMGCNGGQPSGAWRWFKSTGVVTGGDYQDGSDTCKDYSFPPCAHHVNSSKYEPCPDKEYSTPKCQRQCSNDKFEGTYSTDKHKATSAYSVHGVENIMTEIMTNGPVTAAFSVYADFPTYQSGVYKHSSGDMLGGHAIKIIGWGEENGEEYWTVVNSWNEGWGDHGTFKILKGSNECGIEGQVVAGEVKSTNLRGF